MVDWMAIAGACGLTALVGVGFVLWEHYENQRAARERLRRRMTEPLPVRVAARHRLDVRRRRDAA
ncbi:MAG TPA: hypothetical protein VFL90_02600 [Methylomirabilota bacterium]|nr:hypothetical protein [Methylomirabilota bacterium]